MNERIKELAIQVQRTEMPGVLYAHPEFVGKFAKLIVKETLQVARAGIEYGDSMEDAVYRYFGVKE